MHLIPFYAVDPELAIDETRVIHLLVPHEGIPLEDYSLVEFYCLGSRERTPSQESLDDLEIARAFGWVATVPPMRG
jgi:hypothetical protein